MQRTGGCCGVTRRGLLLGAAAGLAAGVPLGWQALRGWQTLGGGQTLRGGQAAGDRLAGPSSAAPPTPPGMPGPYPGRVVEVQHDHVLSPAHEVDRAAVRSMMERGMMALTRLGDVAEAWRRFFERGDIVGIKVNPVGRRPLPGEGGRVAGAAPSISSPEVVLETVRALHEYCAIPKRNLIVFERYADEFRDAGYERMMQTRELEECRWYASSFRYDNAQLRIDGQDPRQLRDPHVVGYDPDVFVSMGFAAPEHDARDDRRHRSHLSMIVTRMVNKLITIPCLKDHKSAGVTLALKNMSHGLCNNVARSHVSGIYRRSGALSGPNQCNTFIPTAVNQQPLREKAVLHILDGLVGVYEGGPGSWNRTWGTWPHRALFFATDPVALDHVGWDLIDAKRAELGWAPVGHMGLVQGAAGLRLPAERVVQLATSPPPAAAAILAEHQARVGRISEPFDRRQPEHIALAGLLGLGTFGGERFEHRRLREA